MTLRSQARLHHILFTLSSLYYGDGEPGGTWRGSWYAYDNGSGDRIVVAWNAKATVALVFDHESSRSEYDLDEDDRQPLRHLRGIAGPARTLAAKTAADFENLVTAGLWSDGESIHRSDRGTAHGLDLLAGFTMTPAQALPKWLELASLTKAHGALALRLAAAPRVKLTAADTATLLALPAGVEAIDLAAARAVQRELAAAGITWTVPVAQLRALAKRVQERGEATVAAALSPDERALFEAARANDAKTIKALLKRGVAIDIRTVDKQWEYTPAGDTPLIQACKANAHAAARALIAAGADPNARNKFAQTALLWAARANFDDVVAACLAAGGDPNLTDTSGEAPLLRAAQAGNTAMVDRLLAAGADPKRRTRSGVTAGERAGMHGHHDLARRLR